MRRNRLGMVCLMTWGMVTGVLGQQPAGRQVVEAAEQTLLSLGMEEIRVLDGCSKRVGEGYPTIMSLRDGRLRNRFGSMQKGWN